MVGVHTDEMYISFVFCPFNPCFLSGKHFEEMDHLAVEILKGTGNGAKADPFSLHYFPQRPLPSPWPSSSSSLPESGASVPGGDGELS